MRFQKISIAWNGADNLGIRMLDEQHRGIVSTINSLYYPRRNNHTKELLYSNHATQVAHLEQDAARIWRAGETPCHHSLFYGRNGGPGEAYPEPGW